MTIQVYETDNYLSKLLIYVNKGDEVVITQNGKPVARLIPAEQKTKNKCLVVQKGKSLSCQILTIHFQKIFCNPLNHESNT